MDTRPNDPKPAEPAKDEPVIDEEIDKQPKPLDNLPNVQPSRTTANSSRRLIILAGLFIAAVIGLSLFMILRAS
jgi:hypothetical protein